MVSLKKKIQTIIIPIKFKNIFFLDSPRAIGTLIFLLYCCCQVSTEVKNYEEKKIVKQIDINKFDEFTKKN